MTARPDRASAPAAPPEALKARVLAAARARPAPARGAAPGLGDAALAAGAMLAMLAVLAAAGGPAHAQGRPAAAGAAVVAGTLALAALATRLALPRRSMLSPPRGRLLGVAIGVPLLVGAWLALWHGAYDDPFVRTGVRCLALTAATAPWPFLALARLAPRREPRTPALAGAALGAAAGAWAMVMVELWCPLAALDHLLVGHVLPLGLLALAGAAYGARALRLRPVR